MKKVFLSLFCLVVLCGCTVNKPAQTETTTAPDTAAAGELTVRSVWITYYELQAFTGKYDTGGDFYSAVSKAFAQLQRRGFRLYLCIRNKKQNDVSDVISQIN